MQTQARLRCCCLQCDQLIVVLYGGRHKQAPCQQQRLTLQKRNNDELPQRFAVQTSETRPRPKRTTYPRLLGRATRLIHAGHLRPARANHGLCAAAITCTGTRVQARELTANTGTATRHCSARSGGQCHCKPATYNLPKQDKPRVSISKHPPSLQQQQKLQQLRHDRLWSHSNNEAITREGNLTSPTPIPHDSHAHVLGEATRRRRVRQVHRRELPHARRCVLLVLHLEPHDLADAQLPQELSRGPAEGLGTSKHHRGHSKRERSTTWTVHDPTRAGPIVPQSVTRPTQHTTRHATLPLQNIDVAAHDASNSTTK